MPEIKSTKTLELSLENSFDHMNKMKFTKRQFERNRKALEDIAGIKLKSYETIRHKIIAAADDKYNFKTGQSSMKIDFRNAVDIISAKILLSVDYDRKEEIFLP